MKFIELTDRSGETHFINADQICGVQARVVDASVGRFSKSEVKGSKLRVQGYGRALQFNETPAELVANIETLRSAPSERVLRLAELQKEMAGTLPDSYIRYAPPNPSAHAPRSPLGGR